MVSALKKTLHASEQDRPDVQAARQKLREDQAKLVAADLVFIDETGVTTNMLRRNGRCLRGERLVSKTPHGNWKITTVIAALGHDRMTAPMTLDGPMTGEMFKAWLVKFLVPTLKPGMTVFMDNLPSHKSPDIRAIIEARGAFLRYLPPYSPDSNPIEPAFSKFKAQLRKANAPSIKELWREIAKAIKSFKPEDCAAFFKHCGYAN